MKQIDWASMTDKGQVDALQEFFVRVDELNRLAYEGSLTRREVASRLLDLNEDLFAAFGDGGETPGTLTIRTVLENGSTEGTRMENAPTEDQNRAIDELATRLDELNRHADELSAERIVARTVELVDDFVEEIYGERNDRPATGEIATAAEMVEQEALERRRDAARPESAAEQDVAQERPFTEETWAGSNAEAPPGAPSRRRSPRAGCPGPRGGRRRRAPGREDADGRSNEDRGRRRDDACARSGRRPPRLPRAE